MSPWWMALPGVAAVLGVLALFSGLAWLLRGRPFKGLRGMVSGGTLLAVAFALSMLGLNIQSYSRLTWEESVATVAVAQTGEGAFEVTVAETGKPAHVYPLTGEQWQLDARVITWKPWANILGLDTQFELERIWGRHLQGPERNTAAALDLVRERPGLDAVLMAKRLGAWSPLSQREFGSAVYMPLVDGAIYDVRISQKALVVDPANPIAKEAVAAGGLGREIPAEEAGAGEGGGFRLRLPWTTE